MKRLIFFPLFLILISCAQFNKQPASSEHLDSKINSSRQVANSNVEFSFKANVMDQDQLQADQKISLINWVESGQRDVPSDIYNRTKHFGKFIKFKKTTKLVGCKKVRAQVLVRDSRIPAISTDANRCTVEKGEWLDVYSGKVFFQDSDLQVDHVVPLKEAYVSGAHKWSQAKRCVYNNFLDFKPHLQVVSVFENTSKSDNTPAEYLPSHRPSVCNYLKDWLSVKLIWNLTLNADEVDAIEKHIEDFKCDKDSFFMQPAEIKSIRNSAISLEKRCPFKSLPQ